MKRTFNIICHNNIST